MGKEPVKPFEFVACGVTMTDEEYNTLQSSRDQLMFFETTMANNSNHFLPIPDIYEADNNFQQVNVQLFSKMLNNDVDLVAQYNKSLKENCEAELNNSVLNNAYAVFMNGFGQAIGPYYIWEPGAVDSVGNPVPSFEDYVKKYMFNWTTNYMIRLDSYKRITGISFDETKYSTIDPIVAPAHIIHSYMSNIASSYSYLINALMTDNRLDIKRLIEDWCMSDNMKMSDVDPGTYYSCAFGILYDYAKQDCDKLVEILEVQTHNIMLKYASSRKMCKDEMKREQAKKKNGFKQANYIKKNDLKEIADELDNEYIKFDLKNLPPEDKMFLYRNTF